MVGRVSNEAVTAVGLFWRQPFSTRTPLMVFFVIIRTEVPVARNKYPEEAVEKIRGDDPAVDFQSQRNSLNGPRVSAASATRK